MTRRTAQSVFSGESRERARRPAGAKDQASDGDNENPYGSDSLQRMTETRQRPHTHAAPQAILIFFFPEQRPAMRKAIASTTASGFTRDPSRVHPCTGALNSPRPKWLLNQRGRMLLRKIDGVQEDFEFFLHFFYVWLTILIQVWCVGCWRNRLCGGLSKGLQQASHLKKFELIGRSR